MTLAVIAALATGADLTLKFVPSGMTQKLGGYIPIRANMTSESNVKKSPSGLKDAMYGEIVAGNEKYSFALGMQDGKSKLYVDSNQNSDLTDDPATTWAPRAPVNNLVTHFGSFTVMLNGQKAQFNCYKFDPNDPNRAALKNVMLYYGDFGYEAGFELKGKKYTAFIDGAGTEGSRVFIDRNSNGKNEGPSESFSVGKAFNIDGNVQKFSFTNGKLSLSSSDEKVEEIPLPPDLSVGKIAPKFSTKLLNNGKDINFPNYYKNKVVLLDFWATWCGPCIAELPNVTANYKKYHTQGLEILSISFDRENMAEKVMAFAKENDMDWDHTYDGKYWENAIGRQYGIRAIPTMLLVDGNTGEILAYNPRGANLEPAIQKAVARVNK